MPCDCDCELILGMLLRKYAKEKPILDTKPEDIGRIFASDLKDQGFDIKRRR